MFQETYIRLEEAFSKIPPQSLTAQGGRAGQMWALFKSSTTCRPPSGVLAHTIPS